MKVIGLHRPGTTPLHRLPAGPKLLLLLLTGIGSVLVSVPAVTGALLLLVLLGYVIARIPPRVLLEVLRPVSFVLGPLALFHWLVTGWERATVVVGVILALILLAHLVTLTTRTSELVDVVVQAARPLRRLGVDPERVGLLLHLAIRAVPLVIELAGRVRAAQHARGLTSSPRAFAVPLVVGALRRADDLGDALAARGVED